MHVGKELPQRLRRRLTQRALGKLCKTLEIGAVGQQGIVRRATFRGQHLEEGLDMALHVSGCVEGVVRQGLLHLMGRRCGWEGAEGNKPADQDDQPAGNDDHENPGHRPT